MMKPRSFDQPIRVSPRAGAVLVVGLALATLAVGHLTAEQSFADETTHLDLLCPLDPIPLDDEFFVLVSLTRADGVGVALTRNDLTFDPEALEFVEGSESAGPSCDAIDGLASCVETDAGEESLQGLRCQCFSTNPGSAGDSMTDGEVMSIGFRVKATAQVVQTSITNDPSAATTDIPPEPVDPIEGAGCDIGISPCADGGGPEEHCVRHVEPNGLCGGEPNCDETVQDAVDAALPGSRIKVATGAYPEVLVDRPAWEVALQGGWNSSFTVRGSPTFTISPDSPAGKSSASSMTIEKGIVRIE